MRVILRARKETIIILELGRRRRLSSRGEFKVELRGGGEDRGGVEWARKRARISKLGRVVNCRRRGGAREKVSFPSLPISLPLSPRLCHEVTPTPLPRSHSALHSCVLGVSRSCREMRMRRTRGIGGGGGDGGRGAKGPCTNDVSLIFGIFDPLPCQNS